MGEKREAGGGKQGRGPSEDRPGGTYRGGKKGNNKKIRPLEEEKRIKPSGPSDARAWPPAQRLAPGLGPGACAPLCAGGSWGGKPSPPPPADPTQLTHPSLPATRTSEFRPQEFPSFSICSPPPHHPATSGSVPCHSMPN